MSVATAQMELRSEKSVQGFTAHVEDVVQRAVDAGAELIVLPELASTGLLGSISDHQVTSETVRDDYWHALTAMTDNIVHSMSEFAVRHGVTLLGGSHNRIDKAGHLRNTAYVLHPDGAVDIQDKIHLTPQEHAMGTRGGDELLVTKIGPFTAGVLICADIQFPELSRHLVSRGVDLILCPSLTWNRRGVHRVRTGSQARAIENQLYVVMSPLVGCSGLPTDAPMHAVGRAVVTTPVDKNVGLNDGVLAEGTTGGEELVTAVLDREVLLASRANPEAPGLSLRRRDLYAQLDR
nr:nitrilase-related carbon-nitrogen hydrolase [Nocardioides luti]